MRVVAYLRVSTDRQAEEGLGFDVQEQAIRAWAKHGGHRVVAWTRDEGVSGSNDAACECGASWLLFIDSDADLVSTHLRVQGAALAEPSPEPRLARTRAAVRRCCRESASRHR